jgi:hypothetical protein
MYISAIDYKQFAMPYIFARGLKNGKSASRDNSYNGRLIKGTSKN